MSAVFGGQSIGFVNNEIVSKAFDIGMFHMGEETERIRIGQGAVFGEAFSKVAALWVVKTASVSTVVSGIDPTGGIDLDTKSVTASFGKNFIDFPAWVVSPNELAHGSRRLLVDSGSNDCAGDRAALSGIQPAIWTPSQTVGAGVGVFQTETGQVNDRITIRHVIVIPVRVKKKIRRIEHPDTTSAPTNGSDNIQTVNKSLVRVKLSVAVGVFMDRNPVLALDMIGRCGRSLVIDIAVVSVFTDDFESGWFGVLTILNHPESSLFVKVAKDRLSDIRF